MLKPDFFANNRAKLRAAFPDDKLFLFTANLATQRTESSTYKFRQNNNFWYLTGISEPNVLLLMDGDKEFLVLPELDEVQLLFGGAINKERLSQVSGVDSFLTDAEARNRISGRNRVVTLVPLPAFNPSENSFSNPAERRLTDRIKRTLPKPDIIDARPVIAKMRSIKQDAEIQAIKAAIKISTVAFKKIEQGIDGFKNEKDIERLLSAEFALAGAEHAYDPIVASGINACTLHYNANSQPLSSGRAVLIDAGAELNNYAADITRTYFVGKSSIRQQEIYRAVAEIKKFALGQLKAGLAWRDYELANLDFAAEKLHELGVIKEKDRKLARRYYPHATSHSLGLEVHDVGIDHGQSLQAGMVITVEPGLYIKEEQIGVRLEDDVLITHQGIVNLAN